MENTGIEKRWLHCPICNGKTRVMVGENTVLCFFPLYCPRCKNETVVNVARFNMLVDEPGRGKAKTKHKAKALEKPVFL